MSRFIRASKFRHVYGSSAKRDDCYDNLRISTSAWDTNIVKVNPRFLSVNWNAGGGGAFAIIPLESIGKMSSNPFLYCGHAGPVLDTDFSNFNDYVIASAGEDCKVMIWNIAEEPLEDNVTVPALTLNGHGRKVGQVLFHPTADNVLASSSADLTIRLWDIEKGIEKQQLTGHMEAIQSMDWNWNGNLLVTSCKDKKIRVFDVRANQIVQEGNGHQGIKGSRVVWLGDEDRIATTGFSRTSDRQIFIWDSNNLNAPLNQESIDFSSGVLMPYYDADTHMLYLAGKGDGNIRYYEFANDSLKYLAEFKSTDPQRGIAYMPKRALNVSDCEVARAYKVCRDSIEPVSFVVPRKAEGFQEDVFPPTRSDEPALTADEFFEGKSASPKLVSLETGFVAKSKKAFVSSAPQQAPEEVIHPTNEKEYQDAYHKLRQENENFKNQIAQKDIKIRQLETQLAQYTSQNNSAPTSGASTPLEVEMNGN
ncbi:Coronin-like protein crn1 [Basidiobolus ranarum]|uniref:Coronin n=1 Tax=Basidiobolus ranarum TaxID=34480 RepID=A0ABR2W403_9FUNG